MFNKIANCKLQIVNCKIAILAILLLYSFAGVSSAASIKAVSSVPMAGYGDTFSVDVVVEGIPADGLGTVQFRLNASAPNTVVTGVFDPSLGLSDQISLVTPLTIGPATPTASGIGDFFWNARSASGVLFIDNEPFQNGSALYSLSHTNGAVLPSGSGTIARFLIKVGSAVSTDRITITLTDVALLDGDELFPIDSNTGATIQLSCTSTMPSLIGLSSSAATNLLTTNQLALGTVYELDNTNGTYALNVVLEQSIPSGNSVFCGDSIDLAINTPPSGGIAINNGAASTNTPTVTLALTCTDTLNGCSQMMFSSDNATWTGLEAYSTTRTWQLAGGDGPRTVYVKYLDGKGNASPVYSAGINLATIPPVTTAMPAGGMYRTTQTVSLTANVPATIYYTTDGSLPTTSSHAYSGPLTVSATTTVKFFGVNTAGAIEDVKNETYVIDSEAPLLTISSPVSNGVYSTTVAISVLASDDASGVDRVEYQVDSNAWQPLPVADSAQGRYAMTWETTSADNGPHTISFQTFDKAGNATGPVLIAITIQTDTTPPLAVIIGAPASLTNERNASLTITGDDVITYKYNVDSGVFSAETSTVAPIVLSNLLEGTHTVLVVGKDSAGNWQKEENATQASWFVDITPPALLVSTLPDGSFTNTPLLNIAGTVSDENGIFSVVVSGQTITIATSDNVNFTFSDPLSLATGSNSVTTVATDNAGNTTMDTRTIILDLTAPAVTITSPADNSLTNNAEVDVTGFVDQLSTVRIKVNGVSPLPDVVTESTFTFPITLDYDLNHIDVTAMDLANNTGSAKRTVTLDDLNPGLAITSPNQDMGTSQTGIELSGTASDLTDISLLATCPTASIGVVSTPTSTTWSVAITNMQQGTNTVTVQATDEAGNSTSVVRNIIHSATPITIDPVKTPTNISQQQLTGTMVLASTVTVTCETAIVGEVSYPTPTTWQVIIANMTEGANIVSATATDLAEYTSDPVTATIVLDAHAPTTTPGPVPGDYYNSVTVSLTVDEPATIYYTTDGSVPTSSSAVYTGPLFLTETTTLSFFAVDTATNTEMVKSVTYIVVVDVTSPVTTLSVGIPTYTSVNGKNYISSATEFTLSAIDDISGVATIGYRLEAGAGNTYTTPFSLVTEGSSTIGYWSTDNAANVEQEKKLGVVVDNTPPVSTISFGGPPVIFSTQISITATDTASEVRLTEYAIDGGAWTTYNGVFTLVEYSPGTHTVNYRSTDNLGHVELTKTATLTLIDLCADAATRCNDNNACTADTCDPATGSCVYTPVADGSVARPTTCGVGECSGNTGQEFCIAGTWGGDTCDPLAGAVAETCDNLDNDCDGSIDESLTRPTTCGMGECSSNTGTETCSAGTWVGNTCDPLAGATTEVCDNLDNDCDGLVDENLSRPTTCGVGVCAGNTGSETCTTGAWVNNTCDPLSGATAEVCDGMDNDCDGATDEELGSTTCGQGVCVHAQENCVNGITKACDPLAGATAEVCDGRDNDCDGAMDEELGSTTCGLAVCEHAQANCVNGVPQTCDPFAGASEEICDGVDNDCDGYVDDGFDADGDGVADCFDNCPTTANPGQEDDDADLLGNACDRCPTDPGNCAPIAHNDSYSIYEDTVLTVPASGVLGNDSDADGDAIIAALTGGTGHGSMVLNPNGSFTYTPNPDFNGPDSCTYQASDGSEQSGTTTVSITVIPVNDPPLISVYLSSQNVQYSDGISPVNISFGDIDSGTISLSTSWKKDGGATQAGLPAGLSLDTNACAGGLPLSCVRVLVGRALAGAGTYTITVTVNDGQYQASANTTLIVVTEDGTPAFDVDNAVAVKVATAGGVSGDFPLTVYISETMPDLAGVAAYPGDISLAEVAMTLIPVGPGGSVPGLCTKGPATGTGSDSILPVTCRFNAVPVNTYTVQVTVSGNYYHGTSEDVLTIYDPSLGFATGGGWFTWPGTNDKTNFGFTMKYNKQGYKVQGSLLLIRHLPDGTIYRVKSNALYGLALGESVDAAGGPFGWASFSGKSTYLEPGWLVPEGNYEFITYVEDHNEPGSGVDTLWLVVKDKAGSVISTMSMPSPSNVNTIPLEGGTIVVPHGAR